MGPFFFFFFFGQAAYAAESSVEVPLPVPLEPGASLYQFYNYQQALQSSYPLAHPTPKWNTYGLVRVMCPVAAVAAGGGGGGGGCQNLFSGGTFGGITVVTMTSLRVDAAPQDCQIRFTMGGTAPSGSSQAYAQPVPITKTTTFKAAVFCNTADSALAIPQVSTLVFTRRG